MQEVFFSKFNNLFFHHNFTLADFCDYIVGLSKLHQIHEEKRQNFDPRNSTGQHGHSRTHFSVWALVLLLLYCIMMQQFYCLPPIKNNQHAWGTIKCCSKGEAWLVLFQFFLPFTGWNYRVNIYTVTLSNCLLVFVHGLFGIFNNKHLLKSLATCIFLHRL